nr:monovalent cation/H+ antiporter subunit D [Betaproteobacteria bacterium]
MIDHIVVFPVILPLLIGVLLLLLQNASIQVKRILNITAVTFQIAAAAALLSMVSGGEILVYALGNWSPPFGIVLVADRLAAWMLLITTLVALCALVYAVRGIDVAGQH